MVLLADILSLDGVVKILGAGLAGFGFLLMYLAFQLIQKIITAHGIDPQVFKTIRTYMVLCFCMTIVVGVFTIMSTIYKNDQVTQQAQTIQTQAAAFTQTVNNNNASSAIVNSPASPQADAARAVQKKALDTIGNLIAKTSPKSTVDSFKQLKTAVLSLPDSIKQVTQQDPTNTAKIKEYQLRYFRANQGINLMTHSFVTKAAVKVNN
jgi:hypothetical protein